MAYLQYYVDEDARWPVLHKSSMKVAEAEEALRRWCKHFNVEPVKLLVTSGNRYSKAWWNRIQLNMDWANWLTLAHEFAHTWCRVQQTGRGQRAHGKEHAERVDILCRWIEREGWHTGNLAHEMALKEDAKRARGYERAASRPPPPSDRQLKILRRRAQVARLERKVKALTTRLRTAKRSLAALERAEAKS